MIVVIIIIIIIIIIQLFVGPWPNFQFLDHTRSRQDSFDGGSARRKGAVYTQNNRNRINPRDIDIHSFE
jgi:hypothetical protein